MELSLSTLFTDLHKDQFLLAPGQRSQRNLNHQEDKKHLHLSLLFMCTLPTLCAMNLNMDGEQLIDRRKYWESVMGNSHKTNYLLISESKTKNPK